MPGGHADLGDDVAHSSTRYRHARDAGAVTGTDTAGRDVVESCEAARSMMGAQEAQYVARRTDMPPRPVSEQEFRRGSCPAINEVQGAYQHAYEGGTDPVKSPRARRGTVHMAAVMTTAHLRTARHTGLLAVRNAASPRPSIRSCLRRAHK